MCDNKTIDMTDINIISVKKITIDAPLLLD